MVWTHELCTKQLHVTTATQALFLWVAIAVVTTSWFQFQKLPYVLVCRNVRPHIFQERDRLGGMDMAAFLQQQYYFLPKFWRRRCVILVKIAGCWWSAVFRRKHPRSTSLHNNCACFYYVAFVHLYRACLCIIQHYFSFCLFGWGGYKILAPLSPSC